MLVNPVRGNSRLLTKPNKKRRIHQPDEAPFPVPIETITHKPASNGSWFYYQARLINDAVIVQKEGDILFLHKMGFFGKGTLSRSKPEHQFFASSFQGGQRKNLPPKERRFQQQRFQQVRQHKYERHLSWAKQVSLQQRRESEHLSDREMPSGQSSPTRIYKVPSIPPKRVKRATVSERNYRAGILTERKLERVENRNRWWALNELDHKEAESGQADNSSLSQLEGHPLIRPDQESFRGDGSSNVSRGVESFSCHGDTSRGHSVRSSGGDVPDWTGQALKWGESDVNAAGSSKLQDGNEVGEFVFQSKPFPAEKSAPQSVVDSSRRPMDADAKGTSISLTDMPREMSWMSVLLQGGGKDPSVRQGMDRWETNQEDWLDVGAHPDSKENKDVRRRDSTPVSIQDSVIQRPTDTQLTGMDSGIQTDVCEGRAQWGSESPSGKSLAEKDSDGLVGGESSITPVPVESSKEDMQWEVVSPSEQSSAWSTSQAPMGHLEGTEQCPQQSTSQVPESDLQARNFWTDEWISDPRDWDMSEKDAGLPRGQDQSKDGSESEGSLQDPSKQLSCSSYDRSADSEKVQDDIDPTQSGDLGNHSPHPMEEEDEEEEEKEVEGSVAGDKQNSGIRENRRMKSQNVDADNISSSAFVSATCDTVPGKREDEMTMEGTEGDSGRECADVGTEGTSHMIPADGQFSARKPGPDEELELFHNGDGGGNHVNMGAGYVAVPTPVEFDDATTSQTESNNLLSLKGRTIRKKTRDTKVPVRHKDPYPIYEYLQLSYEEAFFLSYGLGCLSVEDANKKQLDLSEMWRMFSRLQPSFVPNYIVYHYFRSKGWVPKTGLKFGADFIIYKKGPPFYHASYCAYVTMVNEEDVEQGGITKMNWTSLIGMDRVIENASKELMFCFVIKPSSLSKRDLESPACIPHFRVQEMLLKRWVPSRERQGLTEEEEVT
ncbi:uncharacterized protein [Diadema antillarum]|uniref:uncharacterized protein n=1 Tax=Diadema antillarum TaxID=105358 RepID=UPI003A876347